MQCKTSNRHQSALSVSETSVTEAPVVALTLVCECALCSVFVFTLGVSTTLRVKEGILIVYLIINCT